MTTKKYYLFWISEVAFLCIAIFAFLQYRNSSRTKSEMIKSKGKVTFIDSVYKNVDKRDLGEMRFIKIDSRNEVFEILIGKKGDDFAPTFEKVDQLKLGNTIDIFCLPDLTGPDKDHINRLIKYIDIEGKPVYIRGNMDKVLAGYFMEFCLICMVIVFFLKLKGFIL